MKNLKIKENQSIYNAMKMLQKTAEGCLIVVDAKNTFKGTLTDGDIRRYILKGNNINGNIKLAFKKQPTFFNINNLNFSKIAKILNKNNLPLIPIVNDQNKVVDYYNRKRLINKKVEQRARKRLNVDVVIMAGGKGTRLKPFSQILPKPLIPINEKTLIEHIIDKFRESGMSKFYFTINYKSKIIKSFFSELDKDYKVTFVQEQKELGTAGGLSKLIKQIKKPFFISNCDTIINEDYQKIYDFHKKEKNHLTLVAAMKRYVIPFGICEVDNIGQIKLIKEKPSNDYLINTGMYVLNPELLKLIPKNKKFDFTELINLAVKMNKKISVYPIVEDAWIDVGQWPEYKKSLSLL